MNRFAIGWIVFIGSFVLCGLLLTPIPLFSAQPLPFSASYSCPAFVQNAQILPTGCTDISNTSWFGEPVGACVDGGGSHWSQLTTAANRSGSSGMGARQYVGAPGYTNGFGISFAPTSAVNIRWYERYDAGINLGSNPHKDVYIRDTASDWKDYAIPEPESQNGTYKISIASYGANIYANPAIRVPSLIDGNWHYYEVHLDPTNVKVYIDGTKYVDQTISVSHTWSAVVFGSNTVQGIVNTNCLPIDYDDIAITAGTYIGPVGGSGDSSGGGTTSTTPPVISSPTPSGAQACTSNPVNINMGVSTDENATCKYATSDMAYASMPNTFSTTGSTTHLSTISQTCGASYQYYVRCQDGSGNTDTTSTPISFSVASQAAGGGQPLLSESFQDLNWASRSWYDNTSHGVLATSGCYSGSCLEWDWAKGGVTPTNGGTIRKTFTATDSVYVRFYVKTSVNWQGSGLAYDPHMIQLLSDQDSTYQGPAYAFLDTMFEMNGNPASPVFGIQDSRLINSSLGNPPIDLTTVTEKRAVGGCNGNFGDAGSGANCYTDGTSWYNGRMWKDTTTLTNNVWHELEYYIQMNTISNNVAQANGILQLWVDGRQTISKNNVVYRTSQQPTKKWNQLLLGPYMGSGSPIAQTLWIDELSVYNTNQGGGTTLPPPTNLRVQ